MVPRPASIPLLLGLALAAGAPADRLPTPRPEACLAVEEAQGEGETTHAEISASQGLGYEQVTLALNGVVQTALYCPRPEGRDALQLTFELVVGCDGVVASVECSADDDAPPAYIACVQAVLAKADFPAHDMPDGMPLTYPVDVSW